MQIVNLNANDELAIQQTAAIVLDCFGHLPHGYPTLERTLEEVQESLSEERISRIAVNESGTVLGWVGAMPQYDGNVWELHPLVVKREYRRQGIGRSLVADLEVQVQQRGGVTLWLGTDDGEDKTTLSGVNLYPDVLNHIASIQNLRQHPYEFYQKCGFVIVGVMPDANGLGKPDIFMAKRVSLNP